MVTWMGGRLNGSVKLNDIIVIAPDRILDMTGKTVIKLSQNSYSTEDCLSIPPIPNMQAIITGH